MSRRAACLVSFALILGSTAPAVAQSGSTATRMPLTELVTKAREARTKGDVPNWLTLGMRALALAPDHPDLLISAARANAAAGNNAKALVYLAEAVRRGAGLDPARFPEFRAMAGDGAFERLAAQAKRALTPVARASPFAELPEHQSEGVAYDPVSHRLFAGSEQSEIFAVDRDGKVSTFASGGGLRQLLGLKVDATRRRLWVVNGRYPEPNPGPNPPPDMGTGGVRAYDLDTGDLVTAIEVDERPALMHGFNDIAIAGDGTLYVTDTNTQSVYRLPPGGKVLELLLRDPAMTFPNGIVITPGDRTLYVAHVEGISAINLATRTRRLLPVPADAAVNSIDGLLLRDGTLYGVQGSPYLHRIVAAALSRDGRSIARVWTVNSRAPAEYSLTTAAIGGNDLYMIGGTPLPDVYGGTNPAKPTSKIWRVPLKD